MPTAKKKKTTKKSVTKKTTAKKAKKPVNSVKEEAPVMQVCRSCHALPTGSVELVSLLLVLVFALSAVLVTSVYALNQKSAELAAVQSQVAVQE